jgi:zinc/manganese transport system substrate-binding protein
MKGYRFNLRYFTGLCLFVASHSLFAQIAVLACEPEWAALTHALGGDQVKVYTATTAMQDPHQIQARPSLIAQARQANLLVCTGAELEIGWLPVLLRKSGNTAIQLGSPGYFMAADYVQLLDKPTRLDRSEGDVHAAGNPHIQTDPRRIAKVADQLAATLAAIDGEHATLYRERLADFRGRWQQAIQSWETRAQPLRGLNVVVYHDSWPYLSDWLGLHKVATIEPKPGVPPSSKYLAELVAQLQGQPVGLILRATYQDDRPASWLAEKTGIPVLPVNQSVVDPEQPDVLFRWFDDLVAQLLDTAKTPAVKIAQ